MRIANWIRLALIVTLLGFGIFAFLVLSAPLRSVGENERHSIFHHFLNGHARVVDFDSALALANTLFAIAPVAFILLLVDLYGLRKAPVEHIGFFAFCLIAVMLNLIASVALWFVLGGWGPTASGPIIVAILVSMLIPATISEGRIFHS